MLDLWFEREVKPRLRGEASLVRYADDFVMTFELQDDAERVMGVLEKRMGVDLPLTSLPGLFADCRDFVTPLAG